MTARRPRLAVIDDGIFVRTAGGTVHSESATFHRFVEAVARTGAFSSIRYVVPVRQLTARDQEPAQDPVDAAAFQLVPTAPFRGIADYVVRWPWLVARNWRPVVEAVAGSDLVWLRLPASNAPIVLLACRVRRVPYFGWLAGSVREVVGGQQRPPAAALAARAVALTYDSVSELAGRGGPLVRLDEDVFTNVVSRREMEQLGPLPQIRDSGPWRIVWAGRIAAEKQLPRLIRATSMLLEDGFDVELDIVGHGPARREAEAAAADLPPGRVTFHGHVADRLTYLRLLRRGDTFVNVSSAEGVPKVLVEAMAAGVPVVATPVGGVPRLLDDGRRGRLTRGSDARSVAAAIGELLQQPVERDLLRRRGLEFARRHTVEQQAKRLVERLQRQFPTLPWEAGRG